MFEHVPSTSCRLGTVHSTLFCAGARYIQSHPLADHRRLAQTNLGKLYRRLMRDISSNAASIRVSDHQLQPVHAKLNPEYFD